MTRRIARLAFCLLASAFALTPSEADEPGQFDFYVLSLSWSPTYCRTEADPDEMQCAHARGFIVHGLWPQYERGWPEYCAGQARRVPRDIERAMLDMTPSIGLIRHQWRKHGTCSGLTPRDYFAITRAARSAVTIPAEFRRPSGAARLSAGEVERAFVDANLGLEIDMLAVTCTDGLLDEVRVCLDQDLAFRRCREVDRRACRGGMSIP